MPRPPHVAVVGAGAFGGWTALALADRGARVTLVDAWGPGSSRASSGGETRVIRSVYGPDSLYTSWTARAFDRWRRAEERFGRKLLVETGVLWMFAGDDSYARRALPLAAEAGLDAEELAAGDVRRRWPQIDLSGLESFFFEPGAGYLLARRATEAVAEAFVAAGGTYRQRAARPGAIESGRLAGLALSDGSPLTADLYLFACGPWLGELFPEILGRSILPTRQEVFYFGTPAGDPRFTEEGLPVWLEFSERRVYGIPGAERRGMKVADDARGKPFDPTAGDRTPSAEGAAAARRLLERRFPALAGAPLLEARVCQYENSPDGDLILDRHPAAENLWLAGGGSGHAFKLGPVVGEHLAERMLGEGETEARFSLARLAGAGDGLVTQFGTREG